MYVHIFCDAKLVRSSIVVFKLPDFDCLSDCLRFHDKTTATTVVCTSYTMLRFLSANQFHLTSALRQVKGVHVLLIRILHKRFLPNARLSKTSSVN
jgi:hypothetical protein